MKNLQAYRAQLDELNRMIDRLERGELSVHDLVELEKLTADIHAKSVILRYKAFEAKVHGEAEEHVEESAPVVVQEEEVHSEAPAQLHAEESVEEEMPAIDFSMFDADDEEETPAFEPLAEEEVMEEVMEEEEEQVEEVIMEAPVTPEPEPAPAPEAVKSIHTPLGNSFWERVKTDDDSLSSRFAGSKLDSLIGAFGLNEKLRYINDLFDGSSEMFSEAIKVLDAQPDFLAATFKVNQLASQHGWDPEEESVAEFMVYVKRRYA